MGLFADTNPLMGEVDKSDKDIRNKQIYIFNSSEELIQKIIMYPNQDDSDWIIERYNIIPKSKNIIPSKYMILFGKENIDETAFDATLTLAGATAGELSALKAL
jgi:hypothetical protein